MRHLEQSWLKSSYGQELKVMNNSNTLALNVYGYV